VTLFADRHIGTDTASQQIMLQAVGYSSVDDLMDAAVPSGIRVDAPAVLPAAVSERAALAELRALAAKNRVRRSMLGLGYHGTITPAVIQRNVLENPSWYTAYTPYQPEISQGRLEALINFQTMVSDLTGMATANASMLDESTAVVEGMLLARRASGSSSSRSASRSRSSTSRVSTRRLRRLLDHRGRPSARSSSTPALRAACGIRAP
jgi:glycine dehydrogenase